MDVFYFDATGSSSHYFDIPTFDPLECDPARLVDPTLATDSPAGTEEKMTVMQARYEAGLPLFHVDDNKRWRE